MTKEFQPNKYTENHNDAQPEAPVEESPVSLQEKSARKRWLDRAKKLGNGALLAVFATGVWADHEGYFEMGSGLHSLHSAPAGLTQKGQEAVNDLFNIEEGSTAWKIVDGLTLPEERTAKIGKIGKTQELLEDVMPPVATPNPDAATEYKYPGLADDSASTPESAETDQDN